MVCHIFEILSYIHVPIFFLWVCFSSNNILLVFVFIWVVNIHVLLKGKLCLTCILSFVYHTFDVSGFMTWLLIILCYNFYFLNEVVFIRSPSFNKHIIFSLHRTERQTHNYFTPIFPLPLWYLQTLLPVKNYKITIST